MAKLLWKVLLDYRLGIFDAVCSCVWKLFYQQFSSSLFRNNVENHGYSIS